MGVAWVQELPVKENQHPVEPQSLSEVLLEPWLADRTVLAPGQSLAGTSTSLSKSVKEGPGARGHGKQ